MRAIKTAGEQTLTKDLFGKHDELLHDGLSPSNALR